MHTYCSGVPFSSQLCTSRAALFAVRHYSLSPFRFSYVCLDIFFPFLEICFLPSVGSMILKAAFPEALEKASFRRLKSVQNTPFWGSLWPPKMSKIHWKYVYLDEKAPAGYKHHVPFAVLIQFCFIFLAKNAPCCRRGLALITRLVLSTLS